MSYAERRALRSLHPGIFRATDATRNRVNHSVRQRDGLMDSDVPCTVQSDHSRAFITPFGPINGAAGAWYRECGHAWALKHSVQSLIDASYKGDGGNNGGNNGGSNNGGNKRQQRRQSTEH